MVRMLFHIPFFLMVIKLTGQQIFEPSFKTYQIDQGHINEIMRDSEGFLWISTQDGLTKYNSAQWTQFTHDRADEHSIAHNYVWTCFEDQQGMIWVGLFGGGMCRYDKRRNKFTTFDDFASSQTVGVRKFAQWSEDTLVVGTDKGLYLFDSKNEHFIHDSVFLKNQFEAGLIHTHSLIKHDKSTLLVGGENGGFVLKPYHKSISPIRLPGYEDEKILQVTRWGESRYLLGSQDAVFIVKFLTSTHTFQVEQRIPIESNCGILQLLAVNDTEFWVGCNSGFYRVLRSSEQNAFEVSKATGMADKVIYSICRVEDELYWIGTKTNIYEVSTLPPKFDVIRSDLFCNSAFLGMTEDDDGNLWVATRAGIARIKNFHSSKSEWAYFCYNQKNTPGLRNEYFLNINFINGRLFAGYRRMGLVEIRIGENDELMVTPLPDAVENLTRHWSVSHMLPDPTGRIWISTSANGIVRWNPDNNEVDHIKSPDGSQHPLSHNFCFNFECIDDKKMAVATASGITLIDVRTDSTEHFFRGASAQTLSGNFVMDFEPKSEGELFVATDGGLNLWHLQSGVFKSWNRRHGLPNEVVYGILPGEDEWWFSTNRGLVRMAGFDETPVFEVYDAADGTSDNEYNQFSFYKCRSGHLIFGGKNGLTYFHPKDVVHNNTKARPVIESFSLFNEKADHLLDAHINYLDEIRLNHRQNFMAFELAALSYVGSEQNRFRYRINKTGNWIELQNRNYLAFNGLKPGRYYLEVQASNNDGYWSNETKSLNILIAEPFWNRWYAWLLYVLILISVVYYIYRIKVNAVWQIAAAKEDERIAIRERSARDFHDEAGATITKLSLLSQFIQTAASDKNAEKVGQAAAQIENHVQKLRLGMRDFIWVLDPNKDSLESLLTKIREMCYELFEHSPIQFKAEIDVENGSRVIDGNARRHILMIVKEAVTNVARHSGAADCTLKVEDQKNTLLFTIIDNGMGFTEQTEGHKGGLNNMKVRANKLGGTLAMDSSPGKGSSIQLRFPNPPNGL